MKDTYKIKINLRKWDQEKGHTVRRSHTALMPSMNAPHKATALKFAKDDFKNAHGNEYPNIHHYLKSAELVSIRNSNW